MKRYLLFVYEYFYPTGGWHDFVGDFDSLEDAVGRLPALQGRGAHVVDLYHDGELTHFRSNSQYSTTEEIFWWERQMPDSGWERLPSASSEHGLRWFIG